MAPNVEGEAPHNNFDVRIMITLQKAGTASLKTHMPSLTPTCDRSPQKGRGDAIGSANAIRMGWLTLGCSDYTCP